MDSIFRFFGKHGATHHVKGILLNENRARAKTEARGKGKRPLRVHFRLQKRRLHRSLGLLDHDAVVLRRWHMFMAVVMAFELWAFPFRLAFGNDENWNMILTMDLVADAAFVLDMLLTICTVVPAHTYPLQDDPVTHPTETAKLYFRHIFGLELLPSLFYLLVAALTSCTHCWLLWAATLPRLLPRARRLYRYFQSMECNLKVSVRALQGMKFSLILFLSAHWVGCIFYWLARLRGLDDHTWIAEFEVLLPKFTREDSTPAQYLVTIYKGFNALSNLGYDLGLPANAVEMVWSMLVMAFQVYLSALILGTLLNYLVAKDPVQEAHKLRVDQVREFAEAKQLPADLRERIFRYLHFQHEKNVKNKAAASMSLPTSLELKVADCKYRYVIDKCMLRGNVFFNCDNNFLSALLVKLKVVHIMPGEEFVSKDGIPRELYFVLEGQVHVIDDEHRIERIIRNDDPDSSPICGEVPFFLGINHHNSLRARPAGDVQLLVLGREECDELSGRYPEDMEIINGNILARYGLDSEGEELEGHQEEVNEKAKQLLRDSIVFSIRRRCVCPYETPTRCPLLGALYWRAGTPARSYCGQHGRCLVPRICTLPWMFYTAQIGGAIHCKLATEVRLLARLEERFAALRFAANNGDLETVAMLARQGVDINQIDYDGRYERP